MNILKWYSIVCRYHVFVIKFMYLALDPPAKLELPATETETKYSLCYFVLFKLSWSSFEALLMLSIFDLLDALLNYPWSSLPSHLLSWTALWSLLEALLKLSFSWNSFEALMKLYWSSPFELLDAHLKLTWSSVEGILNFSWSSLEALLKLTNSIEAHLKLTWSSLEALLNLSWRSLALLKLS